MLNAGSINDFLCTSCDAAYKRTLEGTECKCQSPGFVNLTDVTNVSECQYCHYTCKTCNGKNFDNCETCAEDDSFRRKTPENGVCNCEERYFESALE